MDDLIEEYERTTWHFNVGGPRGWTTACGIESSAFVDKPEEWDEVTCKRCLKRRDKQSA